MWLIAPSNPVMEQRYNLPKLNSILPEPAHYCNVMMPAFFVSVVSFLKNNFVFQKRWKSLVILISFLFTFSATGYIGIFFSLALLAYGYRKIRYLIIAGLIIPLLVFLAYKNSADFRMRADQSVMVLKGETRLEGTDASTFAFHSNARIAYRSFLDNPFFGTGLGSHQISYYKYIVKVVDVDAITSGFNNVKDACSLSFRLVSETGLLGVSIFFIFIARFHMKRSEDKTNYLWIINNAVLAMFLMKLFRIGHYFVDGFLFFIWLYYFSKIKSYEIRARQS